MTKKPKETKEEQLETADNEAQVLPPATVETTAPVINSAPKSWGVRKAVSTRDRLIAKIFPMQLTSEKVTEDKAAFGDFRDSITNELLGSVAKPFEIVLIDYNVVWIESAQEKATDTKFKYLRTVAVQPDPSRPGFNDHLPIEEVLPSGLKFRRVRTINVFCLLPEEVKSGMPIARMISFRVTSIRAGKKIITQIDSNYASKLSPASMVMRVMGKKDKNDKGIFITMDVEPARRCTEQEDAAAYQWYQLLQQGVKVHEPEDEHQSTESETRSSGGVVPEGASSGEF